MGLWLGLHAFTAGTWVQFLVWELRSCKLCGWGEEKYTVLWILTVLLTSETTTTTKNTLEHSHYWKLAWCSFACSSLSLPSALENSPVSCLSCFNVLISVPVLRTYCRSVLGREGVSLFSILKWEKTRMVVVEILKIVRLWMSFESSIDENYGWIRYGNKRMRRLRCFSLGQLARRMSCLLMESVRWADWGSRRLVAESCLTFATLSTVACQAPLVMGFFRQEYSSGLLFPSSGDPPDPEIKPVSSAWLLDSLPLSHDGSPGWRRGEYQGP